MVFHIFFVVVASRSVSFVGRRDERGGGGSKHGEHGVAWLIEEVRRGDSVEEGRATRASGPE
jgi:hypothetical protein